MSDPRAVPRLVCAAILSTLCTTVVAAEPTAGVIEFFNSNLGHYFMTASDAEAAMIDAGGVGPGWRRTGGSFGAWRDAADSPTAVPVCRFYGKKGVGPNSHFYTASAAECALVKADPAWTFEGVAFYIEPVGPGGCAAGTTPVWRSYNNGAARNDTNHRFTVDYATQVRMPESGYVAEGIVMCAPLSTAQIEGDAVRLLRQATFGPTEAALAEVKAKGVAAWVDEQIAKPASRYPSYPYYPQTRPDTCTNAQQPPYDPDSFCARDNYSLFQLQREFYRQAIGGEDQLRQRVAFALSEILVTSGTDVNLVYGMADYQQLLRDVAFANYEEVLTRVTLHPAMGRFLDMVNNNRPVNGVDPNENYARELLQLFSVGVWKIAQDGTLLRDAAGNPVPTYDQEQIEGFAYAFTGWTYPPRPGGAASRFPNPPYYLGPMVSFAANHATTAKQLLATVLPAGLTASQDLAGAIHDVFMHPNVGPFVGRQLIQKLVTGNPSTGYVARVAGVFNDNGRGVRGDMAAVVRAVLLDPEARGFQKLDPGFGHLAEPARLMTAIARAFNAATDGVYFARQGNAMGQNLFYAPSVFNYYPPDHVLAGTETLAPEFAILNSTTAINRVNIANSLLFSSQIAADPTVYGATGTRLDLAPLLNYAADPVALVTRLDRLLMAGTMPPSMRAVIATAVAAVPATDPLGRARTAAYLVVTSSQYQVER